MSLRTKSAMEQPLCSGSANVPERPGGFNEEVRSFLRQVG